MNSWCDPLLSAARALGVQDDAWLPFCALGVQKGFVEAVLSVGADKIKPLSSSEVSEADRGDRYSSLASLMILSFFE